MRKPKSREMAGKRLFDIVAATAGIIVASPLLVAVAIAVKISSPGPIIFRQIRLGREKREFLICKFRTMKVGPSAQKGTLTVGADPRITRVGMFLRRWKLDELAQLINVIKGEMSLVGPRPYTRDDLELIPQRFRNKIFSVRPGITSPAAIRYHNESVLVAQAEDPRAFYATCIVPRKAALHSHYVSRQTFSYDLQVLLKTLCILRIRR